MSNVNLNTGRNLQFSGQDLQKRLENQENFTALDKEKLKQDTAEFASKANATVKENWLFRLMRNTFGVEDPKKKLKSIAYAIATVIGLMIIGDKTQKFMRNRGFNVDEILKKSNLYNSASSYLTKTKDKVKNFFIGNKVTGEFAQNIAETFKNDKAKPVWNIARGTGQGPRTIYKITPVETLKNALIGNKNEGVIKKMTENGVLGKKDALQLRDLFYGAKGKTSIVQEISDIFNNSSINAKEVFNGLSKDKADILSTLLSKVENLDDAVISLDKILAGNAAGIDTTQFEAAKKIIQDLQGKGASKDSILKAVRAFSNSKIYAKEALTNIFGTEKAKEFIGDLARDRKTSIESLSKLIGKEKAQTFFTELATEKVINPNGTIETVSGTDWAGKFLDAIADKLKAENGGTLTKRQLADFLEKIESGDIDKTFTNITMNTGGFISSWWPANLVNKVVSTFTKQPSSVGKGNVGNALLKYGAVTGRLADTKLGAITQSAVGVASESISNFHNDKSGLGVLLALNLVGSFDNIQNAKKGKKLATAADDFLGSIASWVTVTPLAVGATYGLATLGRLKPAAKDSKLITKVLTGTARTVGKFFNFGLNANAKNAQLAAQVASGQIKNGFMTKLKTFGNSAGGVAGGVLRFGLIMFAFSSLFRKPINAAIHKVFGNPTDDQPKTNPENEIIPELGITRGELTQKINNNPQAIVQIQQNPQIAQKLQENPKLLLDLLDGKDITTATSNKTAHTMSPANANLINARRTQTNYQQPAQVNYQQPAQVYNQQMQSNKPVQSQVQQQTTRDTATYVPSSAFTAKKSAYSNEMLSEIDALQSKSDRTLREAEDLLRGKF